MKIYIVRHEDRTNDCTFFSPLTELGLERSKKLIKYLSDCNIDTIFSSPFIRTLQTIFPYSEKQNIKLNLEYGLSDIHHPTIIPIKSVGVSLPEYLGKQYNYNCTYTPVISHTQIEYPENQKHVLNRVKQILRYIINTYVNTNKNILIVTHKSLCASILKIINNSKTCNVKINNYLLNNYEKGKLCMVYNNGWDFKEIN